MTALVLAAVMGATTGVWLTIAAQVAAGHQPRSTVAQILAAVPAGVDALQAAAVRDQVTDHDRHGDVSRCTD